MSIEKKEQLKSIKLEGYTITDTSDIDVKQLRNYSTVYKIIIFGLFIMGLIATCVLLGENLGMPYRDLVIIIVAGILIMYGLLDPRWIEIMSRIGNGILHLRGSRYHRVGKMKLIAVMMILFCNILPIFIESCGESFTRVDILSNILGNQTIASSSAGTNLINGGPTFLFLQRANGRNVVCTENGWTEIYYNGLNHWVHSFSANGSGYISATVEGITGFNVSLVYEDFERFNYTLGLGENLIPVYFGDELTEYEIQIADIYKQYLTLLAIQPLWIQFWQNLTLKYSEDTYYDNIINEMDSNPNIFEKQFFGHGKITLYLYQPAISYNSLYIQIDDVIIQNLHPVLDAEGNSEFISSDIVAEYTSRGHALRYDINFDNMFEHANSFSNYSWNGWHTLRIAICGAYMDQIPGVDEIEFEYALVSCTDNDFDGDLLTSDEEVNIHYNLALSPEWSDTWAYWSVIPESDMQEVFSSNWSSAMLSINYRSLIDGILYIDICSNESHYQNFTINDEAVWNGTMQGQDIKFERDGWWSLLTDTVMEYGNVYEVSFYYDTSSKMPKDSLVFIANGEIIPIIEVGNTKRLSNDYIDSDGDGIVDVLDDSAESSIVLDNDKIWRLITDCNPTSDMEIHFQIKPPALDLYALTHNSSNIFMEWNNESIVSITPAIRLYSDIISQDTYETVEYTYNGKTLKLNTAYQPSLPYTELRRLSWNQFQQYWKGDNVDEIVHDVFYPEEYIQQLGWLSSAQIPLQFGCVPDSMTFLSSLQTGIMEVIELVEGQHYTVNDTNNDDILDTVFLLVDFHTVRCGQISYEIDYNESPEYDEAIIINALADPTDISAYDSSLFGDAPPRYFDEIPYRSEYDNLTDTSVKAWFRYYVDHIMQPGYDEYYLNDETIRYYYQEFVSSLSGDIEGEIIDLATDSDTYEGSIVVLANHASLQDNKLDLKLSMTWKITDLNVFDTVAHDYGDWGYFDPTDLYAETRTVSDVVAFNATSQEMVIRTRSYMYDGTPNFLLHSTTYETVYFANQSLWIPSYSEILNDLRGNEHATYLQWKSYAEQITQTNFDENLLDQRFGIYNQMKDLTGSILPPGTKIYNHGLPRLLTLYPWDATEDVTIQSVTVTEHERVDYVLASPENIGEHMIFENAVKNRNLWNPSSDLFNPALGGVDLVDDVYGDDCIKSTTPLNLMTRVFDDFKSESSFGMGWGQQELPFDSIQLPEGCARIDNMFTANGTYGYIKPACYDYTENVIKFGDTIHTYNGSVFTSFSYESETHDYINGSMSFDVAGVQGKFTLRLLDKRNMAGLSLGFDLSISPNWLIYTASGHETTDVEVTGKFQTVEIVWTGANQRMVIAIDGQLIEFQQMQNVPMLNEVTNYSTIVIDMAGFIGYIDDVNIPGWAQIGSQTKVLYTNNVYSTRDLCKTITYNLNFGKFIGTIFEYNSTGFFLKYDYDKFKFDLFYADEPPQFIDYIDTSLDSCTFDFDQYFLEGICDPYFNSESGSNQVLRLNPEDPNMMMLVYGESTSEIVAFKNGYVSGNFMNGSDTYSNSENFTIFKLNYLNLTYIGDSLKLDSLDKSIMMGVVDGKFGMQLPGQQWSISNINCIAGINYWYRLGVSNQTGQWMVNFTISDGTNSENVVKNLTLSNSEIFGSLTFTSEMGLLVDNLTVSSMLNIYSPHEYPAYSSSWSHSDVIYSSYFLNNLSFSIEESLIIANDIITREFDSAVSDGIIRFNLGISGADPDFMISLLEDNPLYGMDFMVEDGLVSIKMKGTTNVIYETDLYLEENTYSTVTMIFGETSVINGHLSPAITLLWNNVVVGTYNFPSVYPLEHIFTGLKFNSTGTSVLFINSISLLPIPDTPCSDNHFNFAFGGYWHEDVPRSFTYNNLSFSQEITWTGEYMLPNGSLFAYIDDFGMGQVAENYTDVIQWRNVSWGENYIIPVAQYWNSTAWVDGEIDAERLWCNVTGVNMNKYFDTIEIGEYGAKIIGLTSNNLTFNEYTPLADAILDNLNGIDALLPYNSTFNITMILDDLVIKRRKECGYGYDIISDITASNYKLNGQLVSGNICCSQYALLPYGSQIVVRMDGNFIAGAFISVIEQYTNVPDMVSFDWRYLHEETQCYFESMQLSSNASNMAEFLGYTDKTDHVILWQSNLMRDYNESLECLTPIQSMQPGNYPIDFTIHNYGIVNVSSGLQIMISNATITSVVVNSWYSTGHIISNISQMVESSYTLMVRTSYCFAYLAVSENLWQLSDTSISNQDVENKWKQIPLGNRLFEKGSPSVKDLIVRYLQNIRGLSLGQSLEIADIILNQLNALNKFTLIDYTVYVASFEGTGNFDRIDYKGYPNYRDLFEIKKVGSIVNNKIIDRWQSKRHWFSDDFRSRYGYYTRPTYTDVELLSSELGNVVIPGFINRWSKYEDIVAGFRDTIDGLYDNLFNSFYAENFDNARMPHFNVGATPGAIFYEWIGRQPRIEYEFHHCIRGIKVVERFYAIFEYNDLIKNDENRYRTLAKAINTFLYQTGELVDIPLDIHDYLDNTFGTNEHPLQSLEDVKKFGKYDQFLNRFEADLANNNKLAKKLFYISDPINYQNPNSGAELLKDDGEWVGYDFDKFSRNKDTNFKNVLRFSTANDGVYEFLTLGSIDKNAKFTYWDSVSKKWETKTFEDLFLKKHGSKFTFCITLKDGTEIDSLREVTLVKGKWRMEDFDIQASGKHISDLILEHNRKFMRSIHLLDEMISVDGEIVVDGELRIFVSANNKISVIKSLKDTTLNTRDDLFDVAIRETIIAQKMVETLNPEIFNDPNFEKLTVESLTNKYLKEKYLGIKESLNQLFDANGKLKSIDKIFPSYPDSPSDGSGSSGGTSSGASGAKSAMDNPIKSAGKKSTAVKKQKQATLELQKLSKKKAEFDATKNPMKQYYDAMDYFNTQMNAKFRELGISSKSGMGSCMETMLESSEINTLFMYDTLLKADDMSGHLILNTKGRIKVKEMWTSLLLKCGMNQQDPIQTNRIGKLNQQLQTFLDTDVSPNLSKLKQSAVNWRAHKGRIFVKDWMKDSIFEIVTFLWSVAQLNTLLQNGVISQQEFDAQFWSQVFWTGLDIGLEALAAMRAFTIAGTVWAKIAMAAGVIGIIMTVIQIGYMVYMMATTPAIGSIYHYKMRSAIRNPQRYSSYRIYDNVSISESYKNLEFPMIRTDFLRVSARTSRMPKNLTQPERPHYECNLSYYDPYEYRNLFNQHPEWSYEYIDEEPAPEEWYSTRVDTWAWFDWTSDIRLEVPLKNLTRKEIIYTHQIYGTITQTQAPDVQFWDEYDMGAVVEGSLDEFILNLKPSTSDISDVDFDGITQINEILNGTNSRTLDSDLDTVTDLGEITLYHTDPCKFDSDFDGLSDYEEIFIYGTNPLLKDSDFDGLNDYFEVNFFTNSSESDSDHDGLDDLREFELGTFGNLSDSDADGLSDLSEVRMNFNPMDASSPINKTAQSAFQTEPLGFFKGIHSFNMKTQGSDPWYSSACYGEAYINATYTNALDLHNFVYIFNGTAVRNVYSDVYLAQDWATESYVVTSPNSTFTMELQLSNGLYFGLRFNNATAKYEYRYNWKDWTAFTTAISSSDVTNWSIWRCTWDASEKNLDFAIDLNCDEDIDAWVRFAPNNCSWLKQPLSGYRMNRILLQNEKCGNFNGGVSAIDSLSVWSQDIEWQTDYHLGDLLDLIEFPDLYTQVDRETATITFEWANIEGMKMSIYYDDEEFVDIHSQNIQCKGPFESTASLSLESDGTWYFKPVALFQGYFFPLGNAFTEELNTYSASFTFKNDTLGQAPAGFTTSGNVTVEQTRDLIAWYTNTPYSNYYRTVLINDTGSSGASAMEKTITRMIQDGDFIEFWWKSGNTSLESRFILTDMNENERIALKISQGYFWLASGSHLYNTTLVAFDTTWYHVRLTLSPSNWSKLFIDGEFIDTYKVNIGYDLKAFKFTTNVTARDYTLSVRGIGISWLGYEKYENWPEMFKVEMAETTGGFGYDADDPTFIKTDEHIVSTNAELHDFIMLSEDVVAVSSGKIWDISGSESVLLSTIRNWSSAQLFEGKLYIMSETTGYKGLTVYNIQNPSSPVITNYYSDSGFYGYCFTIFRMTGPIWGDPEETYSGLVAVIGTKNIGPNGLSCISSYSIGPADDYNPTSQWWSIYYPMDIYVDNVSRKMYVMGIIDDTDYYGVTEGLTFGIVMTRLYYMSLGPSCAYLWPGYPYTHLSYPERHVIAPLNEVSLMNSPNMVGQFEIRDDFIYATVRNVSDPLAAQTSYIYDRVNYDTGFQVGKYTGLYGSFIDEDNNISAGFNSLGLVDYDITNRMHPDLQPTHIHEINGLVSGNTKNIGGELYTIENVNQQGNLLTFLRKYEYGYEADIDDWVNSTDVTIISSKQTRADCLYLAEQESIMRNLTVSDKGSITLKIFPETATNATLIFNVRNSTQQSDMPFSIIGDSLKVGNASIPLSVYQWNTLQVHYYTDLDTGEAQLMVSVGSSDSIVDIIPYGIVTGFNISCQAGDLYIDAFHHRTFDTDSDGDGLADLDEIYNLGTDPLYIDDDSDGMPDGWEVEYGLNPINPNDQYLDQDKDGLSNPNEFLHGTNPNDDDTDGDGMRDGDEVGVGKDPLSPSDGDSDNDGLLDYFEVLFHTDRNSNDSDGDGVLDYVELRSVEQGGSATDPGLLDSDGDLIWDGYEVGCGLNPRSSTDKYLDKDSDKISNFDEWAGSGYSGYIRTNANSKVDSDLDGMPNDWETYFNLNPQNGNDNTSDSLDADKVTNVQEYSAGTNPRVVTSNYSMTQDWATYWGIEFNQAGADANPDIYDKLKNSQEFAGIYIGSAPSLNPQNPGTLNYNMRSEWATYWNIPFTQAGADADEDQDKIRNSGEFLGRWDGFYVNNVLNPRSKITTPFTYMYPNGTEVTRYWITDWRIYWNLEGSTSATDTDQDHVYDWQEQNGIYNGNTTFGLNPRSKVEGYGMSQDWCSYWNIGFNIDDAENDPDYDGLINRYEYGNGTNPRNSDTDGDSLPDLFESKYRVNGALEPANRNSDGDSNPVKYDNEEDYDLDGLTNFEEYRFDSQFMRLSPKLADTDQDNQADKKEYLLYWQWNNGATNGIHHQGGPSGTTYTRVSPIEKNLTVITYGFNDLFWGNTYSEPTSYYSLCACGTTPSGGNYIIFAKYSDGNLVWTWTYGDGYGPTLDIWYSGYTMPMASNTTITALISSCRINYRLQAASSGGGNPLSEFKMTYTANNVEDHAYIYHSGALYSYEKNVWTPANAYKEVSSTVLDEIQDGYALSKVRLRMNVGVAWFFQQGKIIIDYIGVQYRFS